MSATYNMPHGKTTKFLNHVCLVKKNHCRNTGVPDGEFSGYVVFEPKGFVKEVQNIEEVDSEWDIWIPDSPLTTGLPLKAETAGTSTEVPLEIWIPMYLSTFGAEYTREHFDREVLPDGTERNWSRTYFLSWYSSDLI